MATDTTAGAPASESAPPAELSSTTSRRIGLLLPLTLLLIAGALRFVGLDHPERIFFDETYYAPQGLEMITRGVEEGFAVHPPLGKWLIGGGIAIFGYDSFGFRFASAVAGTLMVLFTYFAGVRLFRRRGVAAFAAFLVAIDGLALTMSRIAMLDIFLAMFVIMGFWFLLIDRDQMWRDLPPLSPGGRAVLPHRSHRWRWMAGLALGLALATKASAILAIGGAGLFVGINELLWRRRVTGSPWTGWWRAAINAVLTLLLLPAVIYVVSYIGWFTNYSETRLGLEACPTGECNISTLGIVSEWWGEQKAIARFHDGLDAEHPYRSNPITWPVLIRPIAYYYESCNDEKLADGKCVTEQGNVEEILGIGNPAIWWLGLLAFPVAVYFGVRRRDWRAWTVVGFYAALYLPWFLVFRPNFLFYLTPAVPFLCLTLTYAVWRIGSQTWMRWLPAAVGLVAVAAFLFWFPLWTGLEMPAETWQLRMWFRSWI